MPSWSWLWAKISESGPPSPRGAGFADDRLAPVAPRYAAEGEDSGVGSDHEDQLGYHKSWFGEGRSIEERMEQVLHNTTHFASSLHAHVRLEDLRQICTMHFA